MHRAVSGLCRSKMNSNLKLTDVFLVPTFKHLPPHTTTLHCIVGLFFPSLVCGSVKRKMQNSSKFGGRWTVDGRYAHDKSAQVQTTNFLAAIAFVVVMQIFIAQIFGRRPNAFLELSLMI